MLCGWRRTLAGSQRRRSAALPPSPDSSSRSASAEWARSMNRRCEGMRSRLLLECCSGWAAAASIHSELIPLICSAASRPPMNCSMSSLESCALFLHRRLLHVLGHPLMQWLWRSAALPYACCSRFRALPMRYRPIYCLRQSFTGYHRRGIPVFTPGRRAQHHKGARMEAESFRWQRRLSSVAPKSSRMSAGCWPFSGSIGGTRQRMSASLCCVRR
mmetsp:Transcript_12387/g.37940  ORF Transcript_12387/g.37940 Transcript_12387/m.37940 type:complete len:216 (+) Transcript_12387:219-866(+)